MSKKVKLPERICRCGSQMSVIANCPDRVKSTHAKWYAKCPRCKIWFDVFEIEQPIRKLVL
jgi:hypothetical protein